MPTRDRQRKKVIYPFLRRVPRLEVSSETTTVVSETIVRDTQVISQNIGSPAIVFNAFDAIFAPSVSANSSEIIIYQSATANAVPP